MRILHVRSLSFAVMAQGGSTPYPTPPYPQLRAYPTIRETIAAFRAGDWAALAGVSAVSAPFGYYIGAYQTAMLGGGRGSPCGAEGYGGQEERDREAGM